MNYAIHRVTARTRLDVPAEDLMQAQSGDRLLVLLCSAGSTVTVPHGFAGLWWPIRGRALALTSDSRVSFDRRSIFVSDSQRSQDISIQPSSIAIGLIGSQGLWSSVVSLLGTAPPEPVLFPATHSVNRSVCRQLLCFVRAVLENTAEAIEPWKLVYLATAINDLQNSFAQLIGRCPGRNLSRQRMVFLRLQRIRNYLSYSTQTDLDVRKLALMANYSVWRFIRVYYSVFSETPYAYISRRRVDRARELLEASRQCVGDIALAVGFENRSTLTRAIKRRYGLSAVQLRLAKETNITDPRGNRLFRQRFNDV
jgi:AraC family transcriptional regulator